MNLWHHLVRLCGLAIFLIAMQLAPTAAQAHEGHQAQAAALEAGAYQSDARAENPTEFAAAEVAAVESGSRVSEDRPCNGGCCSGGTPCCASGIETQQQIVGWAGCSAPRPPGATPVLAGLQPEALIRPPRSID